MWEGGLGVWALGQWGRSWEGFWEGGLGVWALGQRGRSWERASCPVAGARRGQASCWMSVFACAVTEGCTAC